MTSKRETSGHVTAWPPVRSRGRRRDLRARKKPRACAKFRSRAVALKVSAARGRARARAREPFSARSRMMCSLSGLPLCAAVSQVSTDTTYPGAARAAIDVARAEKLFLARAFVGAHGVLLLVARRARASRVLRSSHPGYHKPRSIPVRLRDGCAAAARARATSPSPIPKPPSTLFFE